MINYIRADIKKLRYSKMYLLALAAFGISALLYFVLGEQAWAAAVNSEMSVAIGFFTAPSGIAETTQPTEIISSASCAHTMVYWVFVIVFIGAFFTKEFREHTLTISIARGIKRSNILISKILISSVVIQAVYIVSCIISGLVNMEKQSLFNVDSVYSVLFTLTLNCIVLEVFILICVVVSMWINNVAISSAILFLYMFSGFVAALAFFHTSKMGAFAFVLDFHPMYIWMKICGFGSLPSMAGFVVLYGGVGGTICLLLAILRFANKEIK